jgi:hypothetical protein
MLVICVVVEKVGGCTFDCIARSIGVGILTSRLLDLLDLSLSIPDFSIVCFPGIVRIHVEGQVALISGEA